MKLTDKGATECDRLCHTLNERYSATGKTGISCGKCGHELKTYYCEERLYVVECDHCGVKCLVEAKNPKQACYKTMAYPVKPVEQISEGREAVFWSSIPICDTPDYQGSVIDANFPDDMVCGMDLPCCGTDGRELR